MTEQKRTARKTHSALEHLNYEGDDLLWGGRRVADLVNEAGATPLYAYDLELMTRRVEELRAALPAEMKIHFAMKANPLPAVVRHMAGIVDGLDVASAGELEVALTTDTDVTDISFAGPGKRDSELESAIDAGITLNVESEGELTRALAIAERLDKRASVALRVNPSFELKTAGMKMGGRPSQFGIDAERIPDVLRRLESENVEFRGFHVFSGSQNLRVDAIRESVQGTVELVRELAAATSLPVPTVNIGGGLGIPYFPGEQPLDLSELRSTYADAYEALTSALGGAEIIIELGRFLVGEAGIYVCRVLDVKESRGKLFTICDGGLHHHLAASGNFGQVIRRNYPVVAVRRNADSVVTSVVGPLCTPLDLLGDEMPLPSLQPGDLVAVLASGAYGRTASPEGFLSHPSCREIVV